jgi:hypothetical protein
VAIKVSHYLPGELPEKTNPGDVGFTSGTYWVARKIQQLQAGVYPKEYAAFNHMFCVQDEALGISEALEWGVEYENLRKYRDVYFVIVELDEPAVVREKAVAFGWEVLGARPRYSYETIALMWAQLRLTQIARLLRLRRPREGFDFAITFQRTGTSICSGYGASWLSMMGYSWKKGTGYVMPARAAKRLGARALADLLT